MRQNKGFIPVDSMFPHGGLNTLVPGTLLGPMFSPDCSDVSVTDGALVKRKGYAKLGGLTNVGATDPIIGIINFQASDGTTFLVAVSTTKRYKYVSGASPSWTDITGATAWTGDETNRLNYAIVQGTDVTNYKVLIITNGKDVPQKWDGTSTFADWTPNYPDFETCECIAQINGHVVMGNITAGGVQAKQNIAWSGAGKVLEFLASDEGAGEDTLFDTLGPIKAFVPLSGYLAIYSEDSIHLMSYLGGSLIFATEKMLDDTRLISPQAICNLGSFHLFLTQDNINVFDGSRTMLSVGDAIHKTYRTELDSAHKFRAFGFLDRARRKVFFAVPTSVTTTKLYQLDYDLTNINQLKFAPTLYYDRPLCMGFYLPDASALWNSDNIIWSNEVGSWDSESSTQGFPNKVFGGATGEVYLADESLYLDNTRAILSRWDSKDFTVPQEYTSEFARWIEVEFEARGDIVDVLYSINEGGTYTLIQAGVTLTTTFTRYKLLIDVTAKTLRLRFKNEALSSNFELRWVRPWLRPAGAR